MIRAHSLSCQLCTENRSFQPALQIGHSTYQAHSLYMCSMTHRRLCCPTCLGGSLCMPQSTGHPICWSTCLCRTSGKLSKMRHLDCHSTFLLHSLRSLPQCVLPVKSSICLEGMRSTQACSQIPSCLTTCQLHTWCTLGVMSPALFD